MAISVKDRQFHLRTKNTSYVIVFLDKPVRESQCFIFRRLDTQD